jgi:hypothetical protein
MSSVTFERIAAFLIFVLMVVCAWLIYVQIRLEERLVSLSQHQAQLAERFKRASSETLLFEQKTDKWLGELTTYSKQLDVRTRGLESSKIDNEKKILVFDKKIENIEIIGGTHEAKLQRLIPSTSVGGVEIKQGAETSESVRLKNQ